MNNDVFLIVGDSPTMGDVAKFLPDFRANFRTISLNRTKWQCEFTIGMDRGTWVGIEREIASGEIPPDYSKWVAPVAFKSMRVPFYQAYYPDNEINNKGDTKLYPGPNSLIPALNLAYDEGAKVIVIVACELIFGTAHATNPARVFHPNDWAGRSQKIKKTVEKYKKHVKLLQIAAPEHLLDVPVITPEELLNEYCRAA